MCHFKNHLCILYFCFYFFSFLFFFVLFTFVVVVFNNHGVFIVLFSGWAIISFVIFIVVVVVVKMLELFYYRRFTYPQIEYFKIWLSFLSLKMKTLNIYKKFIFAFHFYKCSTNIIYIILLTFILFFMENF